jgi:hypothetical protein
MTDKEGNELITQTEAAKLRSMSLAAVNEHVRNGRWRSKVIYGKRLVYRDDVISFEPKTHKTKHVITNKTITKKSSKKNKKK